MSMKDDLKKRIDQTYKITLKQYPDIRCACYGGRYYWRFVSREFEYLHFYLTGSSLLFTPDGVRFTEIPLESIRKAAVKRSKLVKTMRYIRLTAEKKHHFFLYGKAFFSSELIGDASENVKQLLDTLARAAAENQKGTPS